MKEPGNRDPINLSEMTAAERAVIVMFRAGKDTVEIARLMKLPGGEAEAEMLLHAAQEKGKWK